MVRSEQSAVRWLTGRAKPPIWFRLLGLAPAIVAAAGLAAKRGAVVGIVAAVVYGLLVLSYVLAWQRMAHWSKRHPLLDSLIVIPLLFLALACISKLSTVICLFIALVAGLVVVALGTAGRRAKRPEEFKP